jgi:uncharacterized damage-inducible protein DinB
MCDSYYMLARFLGTAAYQNAWANHRLLNSCCQLSPADFAAKRTGFFPSIKATLNHIVTVDWFYVDALERRNRPPNPDARKFFDPEQPFDSCDELAIAQHAVDRRLIALCESLSDEDLSAPVAVSWRTGVHREPVLRILAHLFEHQIHHRGQVHAMLAGTTVAPPQLDEFYCSTDAPQRADELADLAVTEAAIWRGLPAEISP